jgi:spore maturation protein CgeB
VKILYLGDSQGTAGHRKEAMVRLGHHVVAINPLALLPANRAIGQWRRHTGGLGLVEIVRTRVLRWLDQAGFTVGSFDLVWVDHGDLVSARLVDDLKARIPQVICYNIDDPFGGRDRLLWREFFNALPRYDLIAVVRACNIQEAYDRGARRVLRVFMSADEVAHAPRTLSTEDRREWQSEVVFVGTGFPERGPFLAELVKLGVPLTLYGNLYQRLPQWPRLKPHWRPAVITENYAKAIDAAKVCLGLLSKGNRDQHTTRSMEIPSLGGVLCAERTTEHLALYEEDREAVFWDTPEECAAKCFALLADTPWREAVAAAGRRRYLNNPWKNMQVVETILSASVPAPAGLDLAINHAGVSDSGNCTVN